MRHDEQVRLIKELCARLDAGDNVDAGGVRRIDPSAFTDPALAEREWNEFFRGSPQLVGMSGDLGEPGAFMTNNDLGVPMLLTRDVDGSFKAFVNSCRHRGALVETEERGVKRRFSCPFHAWTYDSAGDLVGVPKQDHFGDVDIECLGLVPLPAEERHGLLFVHPDPDATLDVGDVLGEWFDDEFSTWGFERLLPLTNDVYDTACNWKLAMDTFGETYHFSVLHRDSLYFTFYGNVQCYDEDGDLHRMVLCKREIDQMRLLPESEWDITVAGLPVYWLFPNVILMPFQAGCFLVRAYPDRNDPGRHVSKIDFYMKPELDTSDPEVVTFMSTVAQGFAEVIRDEDYVMGSSQQTAANSGVLREVIFGRNEPALHHYHNTYRRRLGLDEILLNAT